MSLAIQIQITCFHFISSHCTYYCTAIHALVSHLVHILHLTKILYECVFTIKFSMCKLLPYSATRFCAAVPPSDMRVKFTYCIVPAYYY